MGRPRPHWQRWLRRVAVLFGISVAVTALRNRQLAVNEARYGSPPR